jgi:hypothetical protein
MPRFVFYQPDSANPAAADSLRRKAKRAGLKVVKMVAGQLLIECEAQAAQEFSKTLVGWRVEPDRKSAKIPESTLSPLKRRQNKA